jgi:hypothetical protein
VRSHDGNLLASVFKVLLEDAAQRSAGYVHRLDRRVEDGSAIAETETQVEFVVRITAQRLVE